MQRIEQAIQTERCVFVIGNGLVDSKLNQEIEQRGIHAVSLTEETSTNILAFSVENMAPAFNNQGIVVLMEPTFSEEHMEAFANLLAEQNPRPQVFIVAKFYNQFSVPMSMLGWKLNQIKNKGLPFIRTLSDCERPNKNVKKAVLPKQGFELHFVGRTTELAALSTLLNESGTPIALIGPDGVGKRQLIEQSISTEWTRVPDLHITTSFAVDTLLGRLAQTFAMAGDKKLLHALTAKKGRPSIQETLNVVATSLANEQLKNYSFIISGIDSLINANDQFHSIGFFELLLETLANTPSPLKMVWLSTKVPSNFENLRKMEIEGFDTESTKAFLEMWQTPEVTEDILNNIQSRTHGHPIAIRHIALRAKQDGNFDILQDERFAQMSALNDYKTLKNMFQKHLKKLEKENQGAVKTIAVFNSPVYAQHLTQLKINRKVRFALLHQGMLEHTPSQLSRRYYIHPMVNRLFRPEEIFEFDTMEEIGDFLLNLAKDVNPKFNKDKANPLLETALIQEANVLFWNARKRKKMWRTDLACVDAIVHSAQNLMDRPDSNKVNFGNIATLQINDGLKMSPNHPELLYLEIVALKKDKEKRKQFAQECEKRRVHAFMPKFLLLEIAAMMDRNQTEKATTLLQQALEAFPNNEDLWFKLTTLLLQQRQLPAVLETVEKCISKSPNTPAFYSLKAEALALQGQEHWNLAMETFEKADALYGRNIPNSHIVRKAELLRQQAMIDIDNQTSKLEMAKELLETALKNDNSFQIQVTLAGILLDVQSDQFDRIAKLLSPSLKRKDNAQAHLHKARLLIRQGNVTEVENHLNRAFKLSPHHKSQVLNVRGEYFLSMDQPTMALSAFQSALDSCTIGTPEYEQNKRYVEQITAIIAASANVDYSKVGEGSIDVMSVTDTGSSPILHRKKD